MRNRRRLQAASMRGQGLNDLPRCELEPRSSHHKGIFFEVPFGNTPATSVKAFFCDPIIRNDSNIPAFTCNVSEASQPETDIGPKQSVNILGPAIQDSDDADPGQ